MQDSVIASYLPSVASAGNGVNVSAAAPAAAPCMKPRRLSRPCSRSEQQVHVVMMVMDAPEMIWS